MWHLPGDANPTLASIYRLLCPGEHCATRTRPRHNVVVEIDPVIHLGPWYHQGVTRADPGGPGRSGPIHMNATHKSSCQVFPAHAGMNPKHWCAEQSISSVPRARGDEP